MWQTQELRRKAKEFAALAAQARSGVQRDHFIRVAGSWRARADAQEWLNDEKVSLQLETPR
jgi:hypothetical protein